MSSPRYVVSSWGQCSVTCGTGITRRYVRCQVFLLYLQAIVDLADSECEDSKPIETEPCIQNPCYDDFMWKASGFTDCTRSCLGGTQETHLICVHKVNGSMVPDDFCEEAPTLAIERKICNDFSCPQRWRIGDFGECSATCGGGLMIRKVECIQEFSHGSDNLLNLPDFMCEQPVPERERSCNVQHCPASWTTGQWSGCSVTCGEGIQIRPTLCQKHSAGGKITDVSDTLCRPSERPEQSRPCNETVCPLVRIKQQRIKFFQLNKMSKIRLVVGTKAFLLPGTNVIVRCPAKGFNKRMILWYKDGRPIKKGRRVNISGKGNLRLKRIRPDTDAGTYTCYADSVSANINIQFSELIDIFQQLSFREALNTKNSDNKTHFYKDPFDHKKKPLNIIVGEWSSCSRTCGGGKQRRNVSCEIITDNYFEILPSRVCKNAGMVLPSNAKSCNRDMCVQWSVGNWSKCSVDNCFREGHALQSRTVNCTKESNARVIDENLCNPYTRPLNSQECTLDLCKPLWNTSEWSYCVADCGEKGFQSRMLTCTWSVSGKTAGRACADMLRPVVMRKCTAQPCSQECTDKYEHCNIVKRVNFCDNSRFKRTCCKTCTTNSRS
ncbi:protein madd-4 [Patella vulgata]|uniref:protein madd-4 n=1 Tax=Patella vulgata TaxID=6465 RepID=UPI0024A96882|nr:protein madd-4 [Patella vulgata]